MIPVQCVCVLGWLVGCLSLPTILGVLLPAAGLFEAHSNSSTVSCVSIFLPWEQRTLYSPEKHSVASQGSPYVLQSNLQALFYTWYYKFLYLRLSSEALQFCAPIHPRRFLNDSSTELHHPVINSLVHTGSPGHVHKAPEAVSQVSLFRGESFCQSDSSHMLYLLPS